MVLISGRDNHFQFRLSCFIMADGGGGGGGGCYISLRRGDIRRLDVSSFNRLEDSGSGRMMHWMIKGSMTMISSARSNSKVAAISFPLHWWT